MTNTRLNALIAPDLPLDRLEELDPETHAKLDEAYVVYGRMLVTNKGIVADSLGRWAVDAIIQALLQDAIASRGWAYDVCCTWTSGTPFGKVIIPRKDRLNTVIEEHGEPGNIPAAALLKAYIKALEAQ